MASGSGSGTGSASGSGSGTGSGSSACVESAAATKYTSTGQNNYNYTHFGDYIVGLDDWGPDPGTLSQWITSASCWSATTTTTAEGNTIHSYPATTRGWIDNAGILQALSTSGAPAAPDWTTKSGLGIQVSALTKAHVKWSMTVPTTPNVGDHVSRWDALIDTYFHTAAQGAPNPPASAWFPQTDLQIMQMLMDSPLTGQAPNESGYYAYTMATSHPWIKTVSGVTYVGVIDIGAYNQPGGHTITMMPEPTMYTTPASGTGGLLWGKASIVHDLGGIIAWLSQSNPKDDSGNPIQTSKGVTVTSPIIDPTEYLTAVNAGFEIDFGSGPSDNRWTTTDFWVAVQNEPDGQ